MSGPNGLKTIEATLEKISSDIDLKLYSYARLSLSGPGQIDLTLYSLIDCIR
jgi:hypothetical protein